MREGTAGGKGLAHCGTELTKRKEQKGIDKAESTKKEKRES